MKNRKISGWIGGMLALALMAVLSIMFVIAPPAKADGPVRLLLEERVYNGGATHVVRLTGTNLTTSASNTVQDIVVFTLQAKQGIRLVSMQLTSGFGGSTNATMSNILVSVGPIGVPTAFLAATQVASNSTEVFLAYGTNTFVATETTNIIIRYDARASTNVGIGAADEGELRLFFEHLDARRPGRP